MNTTQSAALNFPADSLVSPDDQIDLVRSPEGEPDQVQASPVALEIPGYELLGRIHDGAMGTVLKARQLSVDRVVAIKVVGEAWARDPDYVGRFCRESLIAARLSHPNIVATIDAGKVDGRPYLVMEYVAGASAKEVLDCQGTFDEKTALRIVLEVAEALRFMHERGLTHRDVKPANIILTADGHVKLADLGLARPSDDETWVVAEAGMAVGTPEYMSPEQTRGQTDLDIRSDLYALGATLFHLVTGRVPYGGKSVAEAMHRHANSRIPLPAPEGLNPALTSSLGAVVRKLMARTREERYRDPGDLIFDLTRMLRGDRPLIAELPVDALASLSTGETGARRAWQVADPAPISVVESTPLIVDVPRTGHPEWAVLLVLSGLTLSLLMTAMALIVAAN